MSITSSDIKELRNKSGAGMMDCKKALDESNGNIEKAIECLNEDTSQPVDNKQLDVLLDLQNEINDKLNRNNKNSSSTTSEPNLQGMPEGFSPFIGEMMKNKDLQEKMNDPSFKEKMMKNKDNPMGLLNDPEVMNLVGKLASNLNMGNK